MVKKEKKVKEQKMISINEDLHLTLVKLKYELKYKTLGDVIEKYLFEKK